MRTLVVRKKDVEIIEKSRREVFVRVNSEIFPMTRHALSRFKRLKTSTVKFLIGRDDTIINTVSLDYEPIDNYKLAEIVINVFRPIAVFNEFHVDDMRLWVRGFLRESEIKENIRLAFGIFNVNSGDFAFKIKFGMYQIVCSNLAMFFEEFSLVRIFHTWDEIKYYDPIEIIQNSIREAEVKTREILENAPVVQFDKKFVEALVDFLYKKRWLPKYSLNTFWRRLNEVSVKGYTNANVFDALTYVTSNILYTRRRFDLIEKLDSFAYTVLTRPDVIEGIVDRWLYVMGRSREVE